MSLQPPTKPFSSTDVTFCKGHFCVCVSVYFCVKVLHFHFITPGLSEADLWMIPHYQTVSVNCSHLRFTALNIPVRISGCVMMLKTAAYSSCETSVSVVCGFSQVML